MTRKALGRGLSVLLGDDAAAPSELHQVPTDLIDPNPFQPRHTFSEESLRELADSIQSTGVVQPVLVRKIDSRYQLVAGERRWRASLLAKLPAIPALVRTIDDKEALELALTENLLREDLNPVDIANAYKALQEKFGLNHEQIAARLGVSRTAVTNTLRLLRLPAPILSLIAKGELSAGHARPLLALANPEAQIHAATVFLEQGLSARQAEAWVAQASAAPDEASPARPQPKAEDPNIRSAVTELERALGTRVKIVGNGQRGKIEISYFSQEDLNRLYDYLMGRSVQ
ncbi:MAG TPA: ParB/RepB/Spo0J family partition protein [Terriglobia bacterium]|nr:ParB/RepB/Spo0J family partition protein [Terriglobia bacterium]